MDSRDERDDGGRDLIWRFRLWIVAGALDEPHLASRALGDEGRLRRWIGKVGIAGSHDHEHWLLDLVEDRIGVCVGVERQR